MIQLKEVRRLYKDKGYKLKVKTLSWGPHATICDEHGKEMPSLFMSEEEVSKWQTAVELADYIREEYGKVYWEEDQVYGF